MKSTSLIGVFADTPAQREYLAALVGLAGGQPVFGAAESEGVPVLMCLCTDDAAAGALLPATISCLLLDSPRRAAAIIAHLEQAISRRDAPPDRIFIGDAVLEARENLWTLPGLEPVRLTDKETDILLYLLKAEGAGVLREDLLRQVWGYSPEAQTHTLETHIYRLRQKIEPDPAAPRYLLTLEDGYALAFNV